MQRQAVEILKGTPKTVVDDDWLSGGQRVHFSKEEDGLGIDFKVEGLLQEEAVRGAEFLAAMAVNKPDKIRFGLKLEEDSIDVYLCVQDTKIIWLGSLPKFLEVVLRKNWEQFVGAKILTARRFQVGISFVGREVGRASLLDAADLIEDMSEEMFGEIMNTLGATLNQHVYVIKIGLFISKVMADDVPMLEG
ncbi:hypothetical protein E2P64_07550 [Candidatus Bathyarchaeota archaeon]|nr:hypothetical protein E2P64_07550 [Candidatus Bathyarchaeota archaeon]